MADVEIFMPFPSVYLCISSPWTSFIIVKKVSVPKEMLLLRVIMWNLVSELLKNVISAVIRE